MKFVGISDLHGKLEFDLDPVDIILIAGDILPLNIQEYTKPSMKWIKNTFIPWCESKDAEKIILVGGNHDKYLESHEGEFKELLKGYDKIVYLNCNFYEKDNILIYGTPLCKPFGHWYFMPPIEKQEEVYNSDYELFQLKKEGKRVIILSHDTPYGASDIITEPCFWRTEEHIGNRALRKLIDKVKPDMNIHGHIHSSNHEAEFLGETEVRNVSLVGEDYEMRYEPFYFEL